MKLETHTIDAEGKILGRLAVDAALLLMGKAKADYVPYKEPSGFVVIKNIAKARFSGKKLLQKKYFRHSEYLGGSREIPLSEMFKERPDEVFRIAVFGMLPKNKLRGKMIKRLRFEK